MEKHIDTMGFILAAIVISITLLGDREARRSENQIDQTRRNSASLSESLNAGRRLSPSRVSEMVRQATAVPDNIVRAARLLNTLLIGIVVAVGLDALRLIFVQDVEHPTDAPLLIIGLMVGALGTGLYGEYHAQEERRLAQSEFKKSELGRLKSLSNMLASGGAPTKLEALIADFRDEFPRWGLGPELQAIALLGRHEADAAVSTLLQQDEDKYEGYNFPVLVTAAMARTGRLDACLPVLENFSERTSDSSSLDELLFDLGLANAHRGCLFGESRPRERLDIVGGTFDNERLAFDLTVDDLPETKALAAFGRAWANADLSGSTDYWEQLDPEFPISWLWQLLRDRELSTKFDRVRHWRDNTQDAAALESLGFGLLAIGQGDEAVEMFDAAIRLNSSSATGHWGWALSYFDRSWVDKAMTGLKRARTCGLPDGIFQLTLVWFHSRRLPSNEGTLHILGARPTLQDAVDLSLLGFVAPVNLAGRTPQEQLARKFVETVRSQSENAS